MRFNKVFAVFTCYIMSHSAYALDLDFVADLDLHSIDPETGSGFDGDLDKGGSVFGKAQLIAMSDKFTFELEGSFVGAIDDNRTETYEEQSGNLSFTTHYKFDLWNNPAGVFAGLATAKQVEKNADEYAEYATVGFEYGFIRDRSNTVLQIGYAERLDSGGNSDIITNYGFFAATYSRDIRENTYIELSGYVLEAAQTVQNDYGYAASASAAFNWAVSDRLALRLGAEYWETEEYTPGGSSTKGQYHAGFVGVRFAFGDRSVREGRNLVLFDAPNMFREQAWVGEIW
ncbi:MAG: hypothetical protein AAF198_12450 [Pseudomonadota bacterium]